ncbi:hypothetical protein BT96DRAFT_185557 [Gymnopus androsaceus JB14]|uniref:Uncharacterized protein n=1 Tax=Gymnopus androsaceus JB14 TaxID=1447944 RepID=A0A6A4H8G7_9AGAR|nr:hypothetical protein BT96DRAFT_185557 [Gymnopus androsaceus JB14]
MPPRAQQSQFHQLNQSPIPAYSYCYLEIGQSATAFYFLWFLAIIPACGIMENTFFDIVLKNKKY